MTNKNEKLLPPVGTLFPRLNSVEGAELVHLDELHRRIVEGEYARQVGEARRLKEAGQTGQAQKVKSSLPLYCVAGDCRRRRVQKCLETDTGYALYDYDVKEAREARRIVERAGEVPWVKEAHVSVFYGAHVIVALGCVHPDQYLNAYNHVGERLDALVGAAHDGQCKDRLRGMFPSWDPGAFLRPDSEVQLFPYDETFDPRRYVKLSSKEEGEPFRMYTGNPAASPRRDERTERFITTFLRYHPLLVGNRNNFWLQLGRSLHWQGFSPEEARQVARLIMERHGVTEESEPRPLPRVEWGYTHAPERTTTTNENEEEMSEDEMIARFCPLFPDEVYSGLPDCLLQALTVAPTPRLRDALLIWLLANYSVLTPGVVLPYSNAIYSPNLFVAGVARAGSGKSVMNFASRIVRRVQDYLEEQTQKERKAFEERTLAWEAECAVARKEHRKADASLMPGDAPMPRLICMPATTSRSMLTLCIANMRQNGLIINSTEIDSLTNALGNDSGHFSDILRQASANEEIAQYYKADQRPVRIRFPRLSLCLAGTPNQLHRLIPDIEDGMLSRILIYLMEPHQEWIRQEPDYSCAGYTELYDHLAADALKMWLFLQKSPTRVCFSTEQWNRHTEWWSEEFRMVFPDCDQGVLSLVTRHAQQHARIAAVLTTLRKWQGGWDVAHITCTDEDFRAAYEIARTLLAHALQFSTTMETQALKGVRPMNCYNWGEQLLQELPDGFKAQDFVNLAHKRFGKEMSTGYKKLRAFVKAGKLRMEGNIGERKYFK